MGSRKISLEERASEKAKSKTYFLTLARDEDGFAMELEVPGQAVSPLRLVSEGTTLHLASISKNRHFEANDADLSEIRSAVGEFATSLPRLDLAQRVLASLAVRPFLTGVKWSRGELLWRIHTTKGSLWLGKETLPREADLRVGKWRVILSPDGEISRTIESQSVQVPGAELAAGVAEGIRILTELMVPSQPKVEGVRRSGQGWMMTRNGHVQMSLKGNPYEIGHQHGSLDPEGVRQVCRRLVYGVGLLYSFKNGDWFPQAARELVERQRPFIAPVYFEEMNGLADGAGIPLELVQMANIFPEFFHCSGVALMGEATAGGELLHARVLDYMVGIGLQDHAAVMAISRPGANRFVTVGYVGFIGSVTGMNEKQVAIGEMGGKGEGDWDGIPMSLLIRQSLEDCDTLAEVETFMRTSPRTCEYFYLISDGKGPSAVGVAVTPSKFETFGPGVWNERLKEPVKDAILISGPGRYENLVKRVRAGYGSITHDDLIEIIKRPVAMKSNLHNVIFRPESLRLSVADATRGGMACDQPYRTYSWDDLFSDAPSP